MQISITKGQSRLIAVGILILFFIVSIAIMRPNKSVSSKSDTQSDNQQEETALSQNPLEENSTFALQEFHRSETKNGKTVWEVKGANAKFFPEDNSVQVNNGKLWFFDDKGEAIKLKAKQALLHLDGVALKKAILTDELVLKYGDKVTVNTDKAIYNLENNSIEAPGFVTIENELIDTSGNELHVDVTTREMKLNKKVNSVIKPRGAKK